MFHSDGYDLYDYEVGLTDEDAAVVEFNQISFKLNLEVTADDIEILYPNPDDWDFEWPLEDFHIGLFVFHQGTKLKLIDSEIPLCDMVVLPDDFTFEDLKYGIHDVENKVYGDVFQLDPGADAYINNFIFSTRLAFNFLSFVDHTKL